MHLMYALFGFERFNNVLFAIWRTGLGSLAELYWCGIN